MSPTRTPERTTPTTLVIGGTGQSGRRVAERLAALGAEVRIGSRGGGTRFDWADETTWRPALRGADAAYITYHPDIGSPAAAGAVGAFARLAVEVGTRRLVLLSGRGSAPAREAERALADSGAEWTVVRSSWFAENFDEGFLGDAVRSGVLAFPAGAFEEPFISADDIAEIAVAALTGDRHAGQVYDVTGPRLLTFGDAAAEISRVAGIAVQYVPISFDEYAAALTASGLPQVAAAETVEVFRTVLDGRNAMLTDGVTRALGRLQPTSPTTRARPRPRARGKPSAGAGEQHADVHAGRSRPTRWLSWTRPLPPRHRIRTPPISAWRASRASTRRRSALPSR